MNDIQVLIVEDECDQVELRKQSLPSLLAQARSRHHLPFIKDGAPHIAIAANWPEAQALLDQHTFDIAFVDLALSRNADDKVGLLVLDCLKPTECLTFVVSAHITFKQTVQEKGAHFFGKGSPTDADITELLGEHLTRINRRRGPDAIKMCELDQLIIGRSSAMMNVKREIVRAAELDTQILLLGATGTGKGAVAEAIHKLSARKGKKLVRVNFSGLAEETFLNELFGHNKGAYTGGGENYDGHFGRANGSTLLFDEIGDASLKVQNALHEVFQEREYNRLGGTGAVQVDFRIIIATERDLNDLIKQGRMREAFKARLGKGIIIRLPSLSERKGDIELLVQGFLSRYSREYKRVPEITIEDECLDHLTNEVDFDDNVRGLESLIEDLVAQCPGVKIRMNLLLPTLKQRKSPGAAFGGGTGDKAEMFKQFLLAIGIDWRQAAYKDKQLKVLKEVKLLCYAWCLPGLMKKHSGNESAIAAELGINRETLDTWLKELNMKTPKSHKGNPADKDNSD